MGISSSKRKGPGTTRPSSLLRDHRCWVWAVCGFVGKQNGKPMAVSGGGIADGTEKDYGIRVWDLTTNTVVALLEGHALDVLALHVFEDASTGGQRLASGSADNTIIVWCLDSYEKVATMTGHSDSVHSVCCFAPEPSDSPPFTVLASASCDRTVRLWRADSGDCLAVLTGHTGGLASICSFLSTGKDPGRMLVTGSWDSTIRVWNAKKRECVRVLEGHSDFVDAVCLTWRSGATESRQQLIASGSRDHTIRLWDADSPAGSAAGVLKGHTGWVYTLAAVCGEKGRPFLASGSWDHSLRVWDVETMECLSLLKGHGNAVNSVSVVPLEHPFRSVPDGKAVQLQVVSSSGDTTVAVWDVAPLVSLRDVS